MSEYVLQYTANQVEQAIEESLTDLDVLRGKKILAIGDSFVRGHSLSDAQTWLSKIASRNNMTKYIYATNGVSLAYASGQSATALVNTLPTITANVASADFIVLLAGHNDANPDLNGGAAIPIGENSDTVNTTFKGALNVTIKTLLNAYPTAKMLFLTPFNRRGIEEPYAEAMKEICGIWCVPCFDNYHSGGICFQSEGQSEVYELSASLHLNEAGQERISLLYESLLANHLPISYAAGNAAPVQSSGFSFVQLDKNVFDALSSKDPATVYLVNGHGVFVGATCIVSADMLDSSTEDPAPDTISFTITNQLSNATTNNTLSAISGNSLYTAKISPHDGYQIESITVTMGGADVTNSVWDADSHTISIAQVTGNIVITAVAAATDSGTGILLSSLTLFEIGTGNIQNNQYHLSALDSQKNRLSANIETIEFQAGDTITIGNYSTYKFALSTTPVSGSNNWIDGGYQSKARTLTAAEAADMRMMMVARLDDAQITSEDVAYINANAKILRG